MPNTFGFAVVSGACVRASLGKQVACRKQLSKNVRTEYNRVAQGAHPHLHLVVVGRREEELLHFLLCERGRAASGGVGEREGCDATRNDDNNLSDS